MQEGRALLRSVAFLGESMHHCLRATSARTRKLPARRPFPDDLYPLVQDDVHDTTRASREALAEAQDAMAELRKTLTTADQVLSSDVREALRVAIGTLQTAQKAPADATTIWIRRCAT